MRIYRIIGVEKQNLQKEIDFVVNKDIHSICIQNGHRGERGIGTGVPSADQRFF